MIDWEMVGDGYYVHESICVKCGYRFIHVRQKNALLKDCECGKCGLTGFIIKTGQELDDMEGEEE